MTVFTLKRLTDGNVELGPVGERWEVMSLRDAEQRLGANLAVLERVTGDLTLAWQGPDGLVYCDDVYASCWSTLLQVVATHGRWMK